MPNNRDTILLETVKTHRSRLLAAFLYGELSERRLANDNVKRLVGSVVLAAVICAGCVGFSVVTSLIASQASKTQQPTAGLKPGIDDQPYAADNFDRTRRSGWGSAELGGKWNTAGRSGDYAVRDGAGVLEVAPGTTRSARLGVLRESADVTTSLRPGASGRGPVSLQVTGRQTGGDRYGAEVGVTADNQVSVALVSRQDGKTLRLSDTVSLRPATDPTTKDISVRLQTYGVNPTTVRARVWPAGQTEPADWTVVAQDGYPGLQRSGAVGIGASAAKDAEELRVSVLDFVARPVIG